MRERFRAGENKPSVVPLHPQRGGSVFVGCAIGCGVLVILAVVGLLILWWWLLAPTTIPKPQSAMLPDVRSFVVARLDPDNKPVLDLIGRVVAESPSGAGKEVQQPPWPVRWLLGANEPVQMVRKFMPIQVVFSDDPKEHRTSLVFSAGRGRGMAVLLQHSLKSKAQEEGQDKNFVLYEGKAISHGKGDMEAWWFTVVGTSICLSNTVDGAKEIIDTIEQPLSEKASDVVKLYPSLSEGAVVCAASADPVKIQQMAAWFLANQGKPAPMQLQGVNRGTCKLSLTEQMTLHAAVELTCENAQVAQGVQKGLQTALMSKQLAKQITAVRVLSQDEKVYLDFDVPEFDKLIIAAIKEKEKQAEQKAQAPQEAPKVRTEPAPAKPETPPVKKEEKPAAPPAAKEQKPVEKNAPAPEVKKEAKPAAPKKEEKKVQPQGAPK